MLVKPSKVERTDGVDDALVKLMDADDTFVYKTLCTYIVCEYVCVQTIDQGLEESSYSWFVALLASSAINWPTDL